MLKKLVKYGNSNALILDKAILELLEIAEGSLVKIKTDGKAIIITAHQPPTAQEKITPVVTHNEVLKGASMKEMLKQYKHLDKAQKECFTEESSNYQKQLEDSITVAEKKLQKIAEEYPDATSDKYQAKVNSLQSNLMADRQAILQKITDMPIKYNLPKATKKQIADMQADFAEHFKKHADSHKKLTSIMHNPEYMHELQLLAEQYANHAKNSTEYIKATREVMWKYVPEMRQADEDMAVITKKYEYK